MPSHAQCVLEPGAILLGTVALEPNRWGAVSPDRAPSLATRDWLARAEAADFDGIELWEHHATLAPAAEVAALKASALPIAIWSSYASFDEPEDAARIAIAGWVKELGCEAVKFNVGNDAGALGAYVERLGRFATALPPGARLLCECHRGTLADDPSVAQKILSEVGDASLVQALVHLGDEPEYLDAMFSALGDRITHVHVNFLNRGAPPLSQIAEDLRARVERIRKHGFEGSYTIEFVNGVGSAADRPDSLLEAAVRDLAVLREVLG